MFFFAMPLPRRAPSLFHSEAHAERKTVFIVDGMLPLELRHQSSDYHHSERFCVRVIVIRRKAPAFVPVVYRDIPVPFFDCDTYGGRRGILEGVFQRIGEQLVDDQSARDRYP
jgi:hypothetical protein